MNGDFIRYRGLIAVAVSAGVMIGAAGVFLYQQLFGGKKTLLLQQDINKLGLSVAEIRKELEDLRNLQKRLRSSRSTLGAPSVTTEAETDMFSTVGGDELDDEFYEISSDNETTVSALTMFSGSVLEESKTSSYQEIDLMLEAHSREDKIKAYGLLLELLEKEGESDELLWRLTKACHSMSSVYGVEGDIDKKKEFTLKGIEFGQKAIELNKSNWSAHKWYAICVGNRGQLPNVTVKEKLRDGNIFKVHVDIAIAINPQDHVLHHLLGRFHYEVASLSWLEKKVANTLFGEVPRCSYKDAINSLLETEKLNPSAWKENRLLLSKCYIAVNDLKEALQWLVSAKEVSDSSPEGLAADKEIEVLLKKHNFRGLKT